MKCRIAKTALLSEAIEHYLEKRPLLRFMSPYDDNEPYPLDEVITLLSERISTLENDVLNYPNNETYQHGLYRAKCQLAKLTKLHQKELTQ
ncbi:hypothetical protein L5B97_06640 [Avibacterium sp. 20-15]|uniref:hypothetical protein n=1 Tax=unclassified Avibacterium TaxID=2685287 RepID=UPI00202662F5|nr:MULTISPECIES: hypothetical protein [unclassified Avibacterium]MCW9733161.1 hypothetical protein [Avibacterium sp. 20-15]URL05280.1 hypothetical protein L4F93_05330 [Avibacterium sp. 20-132]